MSWFNRDKEIVWFHPHDKDAILKYIGQRIEFQ